MPICVHAEGRTTAAVILLASLSNRSVHVCHVATRDEIEIIKAAKKKVANSLTCLYIVACFTHYYVVAGLARDL